MGFIKKYGIPIIAILLIAGALLPYVFTFYEYGISKHSEQWDHFGSYVGGIFSGLAFIGVIYQLQTTRSDQERQDFERTFFMMLEHHNNKLRILESLQFKNKQSLIDVFYGFILSGKSIDDIREKFINNERFFSEIDSYFLNLYRVLKYIDKHKEFNLDNEYSSLLRSFLSRKILLILAFHLCKREEQYKKYIELINTFSFFEHLDIDTIEFNFLSQITGFDRKLIRDNFKQYEKDEDSFYPDEYGDHSSYLWGEGETALISTPIILNIFERKSEIQKITDNDLVIPESCYEKFGTFFVTDPETHENIYELDHSLAQGINGYVKNIFIYILYTFLPEAFSSEQKTKFENLKKVYEDFLNKLEKLDKS